MSNTAEKVASITPVVRQKSRETILKQELRITRKEIVALKKKVDNFKALKAEMSTAESDLVKLEKQEETIKNDLIKELGLS